uniref:Homeodomain-interacting protein kinase 2-like n=1 Tax=Fundulus heteroclitus TaxID=8078 RepID=A0A3Q2R186_FUNHE
MSKRNRIQHGTDMRDLTLCDLTSSHVTGSIERTRDPFEQGSFGKVVRCRKLDTEEIRAIKILKPKPNAGKAEIKALKAMRKLDADKNNLIKFYEGFNYKGHTCLVFEYLNESLFDFFVHRKLFPLHVSEIRVIAQQLLVALDALKSIGLVHCDIKPDNIMLVNHESQPFKVKLIDFGNAMKTSTLEMVKRIQALGYRAPEVVLGLPLDEAVDTWSLGCVLFIRVITQLHGLPEDESFDDLPKLYPGLDDPVEAKDTQAFMSLLKRMLHVNPAKRITPRQALGHRFITMAHLSCESKGPYVTLARANMSDTVALHQQGSRFYFWHGDLLHGVCMFSHCMCGFSLGTPASSHIQTKNMTVRLICYSKFPLAVCVCVCVCVCMGLSVLCVCLCACYC